MNLINDPWIPALRREDGKREYIRPSDITDILDKNPYLLLDAPRPDFNGALIQFLIGLIQTVMTPEDEEQWMDQFIKPPTTKELTEVMKSVSSYFNLDGNRPLFMQDYELSEGNEVDISGLFIESPGANTIKNNTDHFIKRAGIQKICPACAATALFALQTNAPSGGQGHRTSLRGGGPLTTIPTPDGSNPKYDSLWHRIWFNILGKDELKATGSNPGMKKYEVSFPWIVKTRTSETKGSAVPGKQIHANQIYWAMPRRILLQKPVTETGQCDVCSKEGNSFYTQYITKNYGVEYGNGIVHPLSPYYQDKDSNLLPQHPQPGGFTYRHWPNLLYSNTKENQRALVVRKAEERLKNLKAAKAKVGMGVYTFGYDMDNMKARCWYETQIPFFLVEKNRDDFTAIAKSFAESARQIASNTRQAVRNAWFSPDASVRGDFYFIENEFWQKTENMYLNALKKCADESFTVGDEKYFSFAIEWLNVLNQESLIIFDHYSEQVPMDQGKSDEPPRFLQARKKLIIFNTSNKMKEDTLGLPGTPKQPKRINKQ